MLAADNENMYSLQMAHNISCPWRAATPHQILRNVCEQRQAGLQRPIVSSMSSIWSRKDAVSEHVQLSLNDRKLYFVQFQIISEAKRGSSLQCNYFSD